MFHAVTCDQSRALDVLVMKKGPVNHLLNVTEKNDDVYRAKIFLTKLLI